MRNNPRTEEFAKTDYSTRSPRVTDVITYQKQAKGHRMLRYIQLKMEPRVLCVGALLAFERISSVQIKIPEMKQLSSRKGFTLVEIMIVVVIIGLLAAMAIPAFQKVRQASQDKTVLNNARQLSAATDQYFLEYGATFAADTSLIGATNYVKALNTVASEVYPTGYTQGITITIAGVANARTITYSP